MAGNRHRRIASRSLVWVNSRHLATPAPSQAHRRPLLNMSAGSANTFRQEINMNESSSNRQGAHKTLRDSLIDAILFRIEQDVEDAIPPDASKDTSKAIFGEILPNSRFVLEALSIDQLQNELCI